MLNIQSPFLKKLISGTIWLTVGSIISKVLFFLASMFLIRILSKQEFGEFGIIKSTIDNFLVLASAGIGITTTKYVSELIVLNKDKVGSIVKSSIVTVFLLSSSMVLLVLTFSDYILIDILKNYELKFAFITGIFSLIFLAVNTAQLGAILGLQEYKSNSQLIILQGVLVFLGYVIGAYFGKMNGAILGYTISLIVLMLLTNRILSKNLVSNNIHITKWTFKKDLKKISTFALPASLSSLISAPVLWIINTTLINTKNGYLSLGFFSTIVIFSASIQMLNSSLSNVLLPILLRDNETTVKRDFLNYFGTWFITVILALPILFIPEIVYFFISEKYMISEFMPLLCVTFLSAFIISNRNGIARDLILKNKMWLSVFSVGQSFITCYIIFRFFLLDYGALGLSISFTISYLINYLIFVPFFIQMKISPSYIFYNRWIFFIWIFTFIFLYLSYIFQNQLLIIRMLTVLLSSLIYFFLFFKLFINVTNSKN